MMDSILGRLSFSGLEPLKERLQLQAYSDITLGSSLIILALVAGTALFSKKFTLAIGFIYNCLLRPLGKHGDQAGRLNSFYKGQAES